jgi:hypothetical protein
MRNIFSLPDRIPVNILTDLMCTRRNHKKGVPIKTYVAFL